MQIHIWKFHESINVWKMPISPSLAKNIGKFNEEE